MATSPAAPALTRSLMALAALNFFLADARDGLGPFLDGFLVTQGWQPLTLGLIATFGGLLGMVATPLFGALVDNSRYKRGLIVLPVLLVTAAALWTLASPDNASVFGGQSMTAIAGAVIGPAVMGLTLGLVGERAFSTQVSRNEVWNHTGNVFSLTCVFIATMLFGMGGVVTMMLLTTAGAVLAASMIDPGEIDHKVARGMRADGQDAGPQSYLSLFKSPGLLHLGVLLLIFHFGNAPISRLIAQDFSLQLGTPFRTTAITTGISQLSMIAMALSAPWAIRRFGLSAVFVVGLAALPLRGAIAGSFNSFDAVYLVQFLDGVGAGLIGIATPIAAERILSGTGRFNAGLGAVMTVQGIGASLSNVVAGWLTAEGGYALAYWVHGGVAVIALGLFLVWRRSICPPHQSKASDGAVTDPVV